VVGSGRATTAALRDNYENDYVISDRASVGSLLRSFDAMWAQGMPEGAAADQVRGRAQGVEIP
jgi:phosphatidylserine/phosphatidylglycerophosphate/cardiolipin synthase-like enzyme